jgi:hypothetical protein
MELKSKPNGYIPMDGKGRLYLKKDMISALGVTENDLVIYYIIDDWVLLHKMPSLDLVFPFPGEHTENDI